MAMRRHLRNRPLRLAGIVALAAALTLPSASFAHHSFSMFDTGKTVTITGTVRAWEMVNPHSYLWVNVKQGAETQVWGLEGGGPAGMLRAGMTKSAMKPGDKVTVELHPLRDGRTGGMLRAVTLENGSVIKLGGPPAITPPTAP
jgi:hypothetical protein